MQTCKTSWATRAVTLIFTLSLLIVATIVARETINAPASAQAISDIRVDCVEFSGEEFVQIRNYGEVSENITDWALRDIQDGSPTFIFPEYTLQPKAVIRIYTQLPPDGSPDGFFSFDRASPIWANSDPDEAGLFDSNGNLVSSKSYPPGCEGVPQSPSGEGLPQEEESLFSISIECISFIGVRVDEPDEYVQIRNHGGKSINLEGWKLQDIDDGSPTFEFPAQAIQPGKAIRVYTNQVHEKWGGFSFKENRSIWRNSTTSPDKAGLFSPAGRMVSERSYPRSCLEESREERGILADIDIPESKIQAGRLKIVCVDWRQEVVIIQNTGIEPLAIGGLRLIEEQPAGSPTSNSYVFPIGAEIGGEGLVYVYSSDQGGRSYFFGSSNIWNNSNRADIGVLLDRNGGQLSSSATSENCADDYADTVPVINVLVKPSTILEGGSETTATFTVSASEELSHPVTLTAEIGGTAQFGADYEILELSSDVFTVTLPAQPSLPEVTFSAKILDDDLMEFAETIRFSIDGETPDSVEIGVAEAILTIEDSDSQVEISCAQYATPEVVFITNGGIETVALAGWELMEEQLGLSDPPSYTFPDGSTITPRETIGVYTGGGEGITHSFGRSSIWNDDGGDIAVLINAQGHEVSRFMPVEDCADDSPSGPTVSVSVKPSTILEGGSETTATFTVSASEELSHPVTLTAEIGGTAQFGADYEILEVSSDVFTVTLPAQPSLPKVTFSANILDDDLMEFTETIRFSIGRESPDSVEIGVAEAILTIEDSDSQVEISCAQYATPEVVFITNRGIETVALAGWTLMEEQLGLSDTPSYTFPDGATIAPEETIGVYTVDGEGITYSFGLIGSNRIWNNSGGDIAVLINAQGHAVSRFVPVEDCTDDAPSSPTVSVSVKPSTILEGGSETTATFTISASEELSHPVTLTAEIGGTAQFGADYEILEVSSDVFTVTLPAQPSLPEGDILRKHTRRRSDGICGNHQFLNRQRNSGQCGNRRR